MTYDILQRNRYDEGRTTYNNTALGTLGTYLHGNKRYKKDEFQDVLDKALKSVANPLEEIADSNIKSALRYRSYFAAGKRCEENSDFANAARLFLKTNQIDELATLEPFLKLVPGEDALGLYRRTCYEAHGRFSELGDTELPLLIQRMDNRIRCRDKGNGFSEVKKELEQLVSQEAYERISRLYIRAINA